MAPACAAQGCGVDLQEFLAEVSTTTLFLLDASGSMAGSVGGGVDKMTAAKDSLVEYVLGTPDSVDLGLVTYGHQGDNTDAGRPASCAGVEVFAPPGELTAENVDVTVGQFAATGWTPIAGALDASGPLLVEAIESARAEGVGSPRSRVVVISDGVETCGGDPVASARALTELGIEVVVDVIGFDIDS
jgi:Ca-activated chloride channel homolog